MASLRIICSAIACSGYLFASPSAAWAEPVASDKGRAILVLDASNSMWGEIEGRHKIEIARDAVDALLENLPPQLELGLMAYGHRRKNDCEDIELLIPPGPVDRSAFAETVRSLNPRGMTPLTASVEKAAEILRSKERPATVILVSDGIETCHRDPCELAESLARTGVAFRAHVIAFDLTSKEAESIRCLADATGGLFLPAQDASSLAAAIEIAAAEAAQPQSPSAVSAATPTSSPQASPSGSATPVASRSLSPTPSPTPRPNISLTVPPEVTIGSEFPVEWTGDSLPQDAMTVVPENAPEREYGVTAYARSGSPIKIRAPITPGSYQVRYRRGGETFAVAPLAVIAAEFSVQAPAEVQAGQPFQVTWSGPNGRGDFITIATAEARAGEFNSNHLQHVHRGNPLTINAFHDDETYEVRYVARHGGVDRVLASTPITVTPSEATLRAPDTVMAGARFSVEFTGPAIAGDWITLAPVGAPPTQSTSHDSVGSSKAGTAELQADLTPGEVEVRYLSRKAGKVLATKLVTVEPATASVTAPTNARVGESISVAWDGPDGHLDFLMIAPSDHPGTGYHDFPGSIYTRKGSPVSMKLPSTPGTYEVRYVSNSAKQVLARATITIE